MIPVEPVSLNALKPSGLFVANLDRNNIVIKGTNPNSYLKNPFKQYGVSYNSRAKILKQVRGAAIKFNLEYLGADDEHGPNFTGQDSVTSYYSI